MPPRGEQGRQRLAFQREFLRAIKRLSARLPGDVRPMANTGSMGPYTAAHAASQSVGDSTGNRRIIHPVAVASNSYAPAGTVRDARREARFVAAHELGHLTEDRFVGGERTSQYEDLMGFRGRPWLARSPQGRGEVRTGAVTRDAVGFRNSDAYSTRPNEQYAQDFALSLLGRPARAGRDFKFNRAFAQRIERMRRLGLLPEGPRLRIGAPGPRSER